MSVLEEPGETVTYRFAMILPESRRILAHVSAHGGVLPTVAIPRWTRRAEQLQKIARESWGVAVVLLGLFTSAESDSTLAVGEVVGPEVCSNPRGISSHEFTDLQLTAQEEASLRAILENEDPDDPFGRLGWIDDAICWIESQTHSRVSSRSDITQLNVGGRFALLRFPTDDGRWYWLKATGEPNTHELAVTAYLSRVCAPYLPELIAIRPEWNAWLVSGKAPPLDTLPADPVRLFKLLENVVVSLAEVQMATVGWISGLLEAGAFDQTLDLIDARSDSLFEYLVEVMRCQTSTKVPPLDSIRLHEIKSILKSVCSRARALGIPDTVVHGDLNCGNILYGSGHCQFIDWSEAYVGHPLVSLQHLLLVAKVENPDLGRLVVQRLKQRFRDTWARTCDPADFDLAFRLMPMLAVASTLYGRGDWLTSRRRDDPHHQSNVRALARHMDRAVRDPELVEALCH